MFKKFIISLLLWSICFVASNVEATKWLYVQGNDEYQSEIYLDSDNIFYYENSHLLDFWMRIDGKKLKHSYYYHCHVDLDKAKIKILEYGYFEDGKWISQKGDNEWTGLGGFKCVIDFISRNPNFIQIVK